MALSASTSVSGLSTTISGIGGNSGIAKFSISGTATVTRSGSSDSTPQCSFSGNVTLSDYTQSTSSGTVHTDLPFTTTIKGQTSSGDYTGSASTTTTWTASGTTPWTRSSTKYCTLSWKWGNSSANQSTNNILKLSVISSSSTKTGNTGTYTINMFPALRVTVSAGTGGTISPSAGTYTIWWGESQSFTATANSGYVFKDWYNTKDSTVSTTNRTLTLSKNSSTTDTTGTRQARFTKEQNYTVKFDINGGQGTTPSSQTGTSFTTPGWDLNNFWKVGYSLKGWSTSASSTTATYSLNQSYTLSSNMTLYAVWGEITYPTKIRYISAEDGSTLKTETSGPNATYTAYTNSTAISISSGTYSTITTGGYKWTAQKQEQSTQITKTTLSDTTLIITITYGNKTPLEYVIYWYDYSGSSRYTTTTAKYGESIVAPADPTRTGYTFTYWTNSSGSRFSGDICYGSASYYGNWTPNPYVITLDPDGGTCPIETINVLYGYPVGYNLVKATWGDYSKDFKGWYTGKNCSGAQITSTTPYYFTTDVTLYAGWEPSSMVWVQTEDGNFIKAIPWVKTSASTTKKVRSWMKTGANHWERF